MKNYFSTESAAQRYVQGRPYFHDITIQHIRNFFDYKKFKEVLDIACGTGLSTKAVSEIANHVIGTDASQAMLDMAIHGDNIHYEWATADQQPFQDARFDLITVGSGIHWFDERAFFIETNRLLNPSGWLIIYDNYFLGELIDCPSFKQWYHEVYLLKFPAPARNHSIDWSNDHLKAFGFSINFEEQFVNQIEFDLHELISYLLTQSNIQYAIEMDHLHIEEIEMWLIEQIRPFYLNHKEKLVFPFGNWMKYLKKL